MSKFVAILAAFLAGCTPKPPLVVRAAGTNEGCTVHIGGTLFAKPYPDQLELKRLAKKHGGRIIVDLESGTPYRCVGAAIFELQRAGFRIVKVRESGVSQITR